MARKISIWLPRRYVNAESEERMKKLKPILYLMIVLGLAMLACSELTVVNQSPTAMRVLVHLPEGNGVDSQVIKVKSSLTYYSDIEGPYSVSAIPDEEAIKSLPGALSSVNPFVFSVSPYVSTSETGARPAFWVQPSDLSSSVEMPPSLFPGDGFS